MFLYFHSPARCLRLDIRPLQQQYGLMAARRKIWTYRPPKPPKPTVPEAVKAAVEMRGGEVVESVLKPKHILPPPKDQRWNYLVDIATKWHRNYFYLLARYCSPNPNALSPFFETGFARLEYLGGEQFGLSYFRHTGQWSEIYPSLSLDECFEAIINEPHFEP